ncbi:hypothetical protein GCM10009839_05050 [Catenulispora yoronensis]|uniref:Uncharacterized protein n=1 Tax=Catenulispora yoronensis TaxID=450799 RepID=A0ABP5F0I3_9ACTN
MAVARGRRIRLGWGAGVRLKSGRTRAEALDLRKRRERFRTRSAVHALDPPPARIGPSRGESHPLE